MSHSYPVVGADVMSTTIVFETVADGLDAFADETDSPLADPNATDRSTPFVLTTRPTEPDYPHVIVEAAETSGDPLDHAEDVFQHEFTVRVSTLAETAETALDLADGVRAWVLREADGDLRAAGFAEPEFDGRDETWEDHVRVADGVHHWVTDVTGLVHAEYGASDA
ncbi:hypothetical protein [Salinilacihabitans rarus]|uniref:hypothetical protein n=1 Tax=Salinilacihabitans rarus TaxID=2961596 RepID=UPI0020C8918D|nr:hypothetical protein [Salinilacihabitans rarus]